MAPMGPGIAGLKYGDFTFEVAGLLIPTKTAGKIAGFTDLQYRVLTEFCVKDVITKYGY